MISQWEPVRGEAVTLRMQGNSLKDINKALGIPLSTLSGWMRNVPLTNEQQLVLKEKHNQALIKARIEAVKWHNSGKEARMKVASDQAELILEKVSAVDDTTLEIALAFLYWGEGGKGNMTVLGSSDPSIINFFIIASKRLYGILNENIKIHLHLRADHDDKKLKEYWSNITQIPLSRFGKSSFDKRTIGRPSYDGYNGVCTVHFGKVEISRRLMYIATGYSKMIVGIK